MTTSTPIPSPRQTTPPTVEQVLRNKFWWFIPRISPSDLRLVTLDCNCSPGLVSEGHYDIALYDGEWIPCLPPGTDAPIVDAAELARLRAETAELRAECNRANNLLNGSRAVADYPPDTDHCTVCGGLLGGLYEWTDEPQRLRRHAAPGSRCAAIGAA